MYLCPEIPLAAGSDVVWLAGCPSFSLQNWWENESRGEPTYVIVPAVPGWAGDGPWFTPRRTNPDRGNSVPV